MRTGLTIAMGVLLVLLGAAILVRTIAEGGGAGFRVGYLAGPAIAGAGAARIWLARAQRRVGEHPRTPNDGGR